MKIFKGVVISKKMSKTVTVLLENTYMHRLYGKRYIRSRKYHVHDDFESKVGDAVLFVASKPYSKQVKWKVIKTNEGKSGDKTEDVKRKKKVGRDKKL